MSSHKPACSHASAEFFRAGTGNRLERLTLNPALRVSGWSEGVEEGPVGLACVEQDSDAVVVEVGEPERGAFDGSSRIRGE